MRSIIQSGLLRTGAAAFLGAALLYSVAFSQADSQPTLNGENSLYDGSSSLQFQISDNFSLSAFKGLAFSGKKHISDKTAIRLGVDIYVSSSGNDTHSTYQQPNDSSFTSENNSNFWASSGFDIQYIRYTSLKSPIHFFWGAGPNFRYQRTSYESERITLSTGAISTRNDENKSLSAGMSGIAGVEWFAVKNISFLAEYGSSLYYQWMKSTIHNNTPQKSSSSSETNSLVFSPASVRLGISLYF